MKALNKRPRVKHFDYKGTYRYFITICSNNKAHLFKDDIFINELIKALRDKSNIFRFKVWAFCFMPDHLHLLLEGIFPDSDLKMFVSSYKQYTGYLYKEKVKNKLWQPSYYDHILRKDDDILNIALYILDNPVRKNYVEHFLDYQFSGSFEFDRERCFLE